MQNKYLKKNVPLNRSLSVNTALFLVLFGNSFDHRVISLAFACFAGFGNKHELSNVGKYLPQDDVTILFLDVYNILKVKYFAVHSRICY